MRRTVAVLLLASVLVVLVSAHAGSHHHDLESDHLESDILLPVRARKEHRCIHDELPAREKRFKRVEQSWESEARLHSNNGTFRKRAVNWQPIRVTIALDNLDGDQYTCYTAGTTVQTEAGSSYSCTAADIMTATKKTFLNTSMLQYAAQKFAELLSVDRQGPITVSSNTFSCSNVNVPSRFIPSADTDFILLVTTRPIPSTSGSDLRTLAYATTCQTQAGGRPIVGWANFDPSSIDADDPTQLGLQVGVAIHESSHALGFTGGNFDNLGMTTGNRVTQSDVAAYVQNHFGCPSATGALLEDNGGSGTAGSHWEKAAFMNEYMTGTASTNPVITALTMITFQAMGWYQADLTKTDSLVFGRNGGCGMITDWTGCTQWPSSYTCSASVTSSCTVDRSGYGSCVTEGSGGLIGSGCSYVSADTTCIYPWDPTSEMATSKNGDTSLVSSGQNFGDARCFDSTLNKVKSLSDIISIPAPSSPKCYQVTCSAVNEPRINIGKIWYPCAVNGTKISATGFGGSVTCSANAYQDLCQYKEYDNDWPRITSLSSTKAKPSASISVNYTGSVDDTGVYIIIETNTTENAVSGNSTVTGKLASDDYWGAPKYLNIFNTKLNVIIVDSEGRSDVRYSSFQADIGFGLAYLKALFKWMSNNIVFSVLICIALACPCFILCFCCYRKCCRKKKKKPMAAQYQNTYDRDADEYYYDEEMDDYTRHAPPAPIRRR